VCQRQVLSPAHGALHRHCAAYCTQMMFGWFLRFALAYTYDKPTLTLQTSTKIFVGRNNLYLFSISKK
jgi:hypothetical protein